MSNLKKQKKNKHLNKFYANCSFNSCVFLLLSDQVLYRLKEKVQVSDRQLKAPPPDLHLTPTVPPESAQRSKGTKVSSRHHDCLRPHMVK